MFKSILKMQKSTWVILLLTIVTTYTIFNLKHWNKEGRVIAWDVIDYYGYLPATFIYGDVTLETPNTKFNEYEHTFWYRELEGNKKVFKMTMGMAILYSPFFFASHVYALSSDCVANGYSFPYKFGLCISSLFYFLIGLVYLRKVLQQYFTENIVALTLFFIGLGTNLYFYVVLGVGMTHSYLFALLSMWLYFVIKWYNHPKFKIAVLLGLLSGLMILVRPTMILILLFGLLINITSIKQMKERMLFFKSNLFQILCIAIFAFIVWIPQLLYWKTVTGSFLYNSYQNQGLFYFNDPQFFNCLFSFRNGWLTYTPIMAFAIIGLIALVRKKHKVGLAALLTIAVYFYVMSSWWVWWFGGSFGFRSMIEVYPLLAFGMAYIIQLIITKSKTIKITGLSILFLLLAFNLFQTRQAHEGLIHHDSMTKESYFKILFKTQKQITREEVKPFLKTPDYEAALKGDRD